MTGGFPSQKAGNMANVSIWWRRHVTCLVQSSHKLNQWWFTVSLLDPGEHISRKMKTKCSNFNSRKCCLKNVVHFAQTFMCKTLWCWSWNISGELVNTSTADALVPCITRTSVALLLIMRKDFNYLCYLSVKKWYKMQISKNKFSTRRFMVKSLWPREQ